MTRAPSATPALMTDLYELTMAAGYVEQGLHHVEATFELFVRALPPRRGYLLLAGLEQVVQYLEQLRFTEEQLAYLRALPVFAHVRPAFWEYLRTLRFTGDLWAIPEGRVVFPGEPILRVRAPIVQAQLVETYLLAALNLGIAVATKASRVVQAAQGRAVIDFGSRRAHGPEAAVYAARAAYIGGCVGTSNVEAGYRWGIPVFGTMAHSWVMAFGNELEAFRAFHRVFPEHTTLLVDTYDTLEGVQHAIALGGSIRGIRIDSGDLVYLSQQARSRLDQAGLRQVRIGISGDLDEYRIWDFLRRGGVADWFGVGTKMVTSEDAPWVGGVYKLVELSYNGAERFVLKLSQAKRTYPASKQVYRFRDSTGRLTYDLVAWEEEPPPEGGEPLLVPVLLRGTRSEPLPELEAIRQRAQQELAALPEPVRDLEEPAAYPVRISAKLERLFAQLMEQVG
ncbi:MAG: nicotinate phosphoribosyltransferase [Bacteroidetes bacterium]|nr:nicotinate phosphoribosyltransferase [Rhodothermia bacterium]MCX7907468.1 nicotinate phosphoribosyltransferase [Bacteroidota bacterium]MDW8284601.1 nicotinate phosphoribosyltransferase [Bacteroidota bacterium]